MSAKSHKIRLILVLYSLIKYSDKEHLLNGPKVNNILKKYNLEYKGQTLPSTMNLLCLMGFNIKEGGNRRSHGYWLDDYPFNEDTVSALNIAISTNPLISPKKSNELLSLITPFVSIYQEDLLEYNHCIANNSSIFDKCVLIHKAIVRNYNLRYSLLCNSSEKEIFKPNKIYFEDTLLYVEGVTENNKKININIQEICDVDIVNMG